MVRVVFIEDRGIILDALKNAVDWELQGIQPLGFFTSCDDALPFILNNLPDVVVTDIVMHGMDGLELSQYLHSSELDVKVIIISAHNRFEYAQKALQAGVFDFFEKPLDFDALTCSILRAGKANSSIRQMRSFIINHREIYRERFFSKLMSGQLENSEAIQSEAEFLELNQLGSMVCVACRVRNASSSGEHESGIMSLELRRLMLSETLNETLGKEAVFGPYSLKNEETVFILTGAAANRKNDIVVQLTQTIESFAEQTLSIVQMGIGSSAERPMYLSISYESAARALDACFASEESCVIHVDDLPDDANSYLKTLGRFETRLIRAIDIQDTVAIKNVFDSFRSEIGTAYLRSDVLKTMMKSVAFKVESMYISSVSNIAGYRTAGSSQHP